MAQQAMTSRERMLAALRCEQPDHVPMSPYMYQGPWRREPLYWRNQFERAQMMLEMELDPTIDIWLPDPQPHHDVEIKTWREQKDGKTYLTKEYHTPAGTLRQTVHETNDWCHPDHGPWQPTIFGIEHRRGFGMHLFDDHNVSRRTEPWVKGPEDLDKLRYIIRPLDGYELDEWRMDVERALDFARDHHLMTYVRRSIVGDAFQWFCDIPWFLMQLYDDPEFVKEFLDIFHRWQLASLDEVLQFDVDCVQYRGWYEISTYWGPRGFENFLVPIIEEETQKVHDAGVLVSYLLPEGAGVYADILAKMSFDCLYYVDPLMLHAGDLDDLFDAIGDSKSFWGGVNAEITLQSEDPDRIDAEVKRAIEALGKNGGLILGAGLFLTVSNQSILYMIDSWRKYKDMYS